MKVRITKQIGQTGLRKVDTILDIDAKLAKHWIANGWAKAVRKPRKKKK